MNSQFKLVVVDQDEQWVSSLSYRLENEHLLHLNVQSRSFPIDRNGRSFKRAWAIANIYQGGIFRPLYRLYPRHDDAQKDLESYRLKEFLCEMTHKPIIWIATVDDRKHPRWNKFKRWAISKQHCVIDEDADWSEFGGVARFALLTTIYLYLRAEVPLRSARQHRCSPLEFRWQLEQNLLIDRLRLVQQRDETLLNSDYFARSLAALL